MTEVVRNPGLWSLSGFDCQSKIFQPRVDLLFPLTFF